MTTTDSPGPGSGDDTADLGSSEPGGASSPSSTAPDGRVLLDEPRRRRLTRSTTDRKIAGVCGGLGRYFDVDPLILRITFVVLVAFGGGGLLAYGIAWLLVPEDTADESEGERLVRGRGVASTALLAVVATIVGAIFLLGFAMNSPHGIGPLLIILLVVGVAVASRSPRAHEPPPRPAASLPDPGYAGATLGAYAGPAPAYRLPPRHPTQPRSVLPRLTLSVAVLAVGVVAAITLAVDGELNARKVAATVLIVLGAGLVVGAWWGRGRILLLPALLAGVVMLGSMAHATGDFSGGIGDRAWAPRTAAEVTSPYQLGLGSARLDLTRIDPEGGVIAIEADIGVGELVVEAPPDVELITTAESGIGEVVLPSGDRVERRGEVTDAREPATGVSRGIIRLDLHVGIGKVEVRRG